MSGKRLRLRYQVFSGSSNPIRPETLLWRYLTFEKFVSLVETSGLWHARLDQLEDHFEGSVTKLYAQKRDVGAPVSYMPFSELEPVNNLRLKYCSFVNCWYASAFESEAMWQLYSRKNAGVAIASSVERMKNAVELPAESDHGMLGPVEYLDFEQDDMTLPGGLTARAGFTKRKSFEHEKEVRGMIRLGASPAHRSLVFSQHYVESLRKELPLGLSAKVNLKRLVQSIYISPLAPKWFEDLVENAARRVGLARRVRKSTLKGAPVF